MTTQRRQAEAIAAGQRNLVVMLTSRSTSTGWRTGRCGGARTSEPPRSGWWPDAWATWLEEVAAAREAARSEAGWVMDLYLLRHG